MFRKELLRLATRQLRSSYQVTRSIPRFPFMAIKPCFYFSNAETHEFKAETKKLLDIVTHSLYTDKDVFLRELLSNASDALEKQRFLNTQSQETNPDDLEIKITLDEDKRIITIHDTGVGMTKQEMIDNLGTIARSGSRQFLQQHSTDSSLSEKIIGQFGVGFYSSFIVADTVEVTSRNRDDQVAHTWSSDGTGKFEMTETNDPTFTRGTRIQMFLKPECANYSKKADVEKTVQRYSNFISFPIVLNNEKLNIVQAIWSRPRNDVTGEEYSKFYEYVSNSKSSYKYKIHYQTDAPLSIKSILYIPTTHNERLGIQAEEYDIHLYSKKVLIKRNCRDILPHYLRFVKGVVDCEDLPLNISRENYQDSQLIAKLKSVITKRVIRELETESTKDKSNYIPWFQDFQYFLKEGVASDNDNSQALLGLLRYNSNKDDELISLDDYIKMMPKGQDAIYFILAPSRDHALNSPYMDPYRGSETPIVFCYVHIDEMVFKQVDKYKGLKFVNIESQQEEVGKSIKDIKHDTAKGLSADDVTPFSLWLKNELAPIVTQVQISKRLKDSPAIVVSPLSSGMRQMMSMIDKSQLNRVRKTNMSLASLLSKQLLDNCLLSSGLITDPQKIVNRTQQLMELLMDMQKQIDFTQNLIRDVPQVETDQPAQRASKKSEIDDDIILDEQGNPTINKKQ